jgi:hypothetical protein
MTTTATTKRTGSVSKANPPNTDTETATTDPVPGENEKIDKQIFLDQITKCWEDYGNALSSDLIAEWGTLCDLFNESMQRPGIYSFNATMGLGKSLAAQVACAVLALKSWNPAHYFNDTNTNTGALIVVERKATAEKAAEKINRIYNGLGGQWGDPAIAKHSGNDVTFAEIQECPVLVICHASYTNSLQRFSDGKSDRFASFSHWDHGPRQLVIIDESINPIQDYVLAPQDVYTVMGWFTSTRLKAPMKREFPQEYRLLKDIAELLEDLEIQKLNKEETTALFHDLLSSLPVGPSGKSLSLQRLYAELGMDDIEWDLLIDRKRNAKVRQDRQKTVLAFFRAVDQLLFEWSFYFREGNTGSARSARWIIPDEVGSMVILDGTADQDLGYDLYNGDLVRRQAKKIRRFDNVNLYIKRERTGLGKSSTINAAQIRAITVYDWGKENLPSTKKVLFCGHKDIEQHLAYLHKTDPYFDEFHVAHWGAATGSNEWKECDTVIVVSLPYRDHAQAACSLATRLGLDLGMSALRDESQGSAAKRFANSKTAVDVLQLLSRCRIRRMTDANGGCDPADLYLMVSNDWRGDDIIDRVTAEMPGVNLKEWKFQGYSMTASQADKRLENSSESSIRQWLDRLPPGKTPASYLWNNDIISRKQFSNHWKHRLMDPKDSLNLHMRELGISLQRRGSSRSERITFVKANPLPDVDATINSVSSQTVLAENDCGA